MEETKNISLEKILRSGHRLTVSDSPKQGEVKICNAQGTPLFSLKISDSATILCIDATNIHIDAKEKLKMTAREIEMESAADTKISSQGDYKNYTKGTSMLLTEGDKLDIAKTQTLKSDLGNIDMVANDDVTLKGERVKLN